MYGRDRTGSVLLTHPHLWYYNTKKIVMLHAQDLNFVCRLFRGGIALIWPAASSSVVRILHGDGAVVGAGFLVDTKHIFTCAHVVAEALGYSPLSPTPPQEPVTLDFPLLPHSHPRRARIIVWQPVNENWDGGDIAGLELLDPPPEGAQPVTFAPTTDVWNHSFRAFGFPGIAEKGTWSSGRLLAEQGNGWIQIEDNRSGGVPVTQGFSGAAVWDEQLEGMVGMVVATLHDPGGRLGGQAGTRVAFAIPQKLLLTAWQLIQPITRPRVFLSAAHVDTAHRERLRADLEASGVLVWDEQHAPEGILHEAEHGQQAIRAAMALLVIASAHTPSSLVVREHLRLADLYQRHIIFIGMGKVFPSSHNTRAADSSRTDPIHGEATTQLPQPLPGPTYQELPFSQPSVTPPLSDEDETDIERKLAEIARQNLNYAWIDAHDYYNNDYKKYVGTIKEMLLEQGSITALLRALVEDEEVPRNPYVGLRAFMARERGDFFGREAFVAHLQAEVGRRLAMGQEGDNGRGGRGRLLTVIGASGSGKSSVVMAGLLPRLQEDAASKDWLYLQPMVPGGDPIEALVDTLSPHFPDASFRRLRADLTDDSTDGLHRLAKQLALRQEDRLAEQGQGSARDQRGRQEGPGMRVVLFVDQFEELFTQTVGEEERRRFLELLHTAASAPDGAMLILLTLRADFYAHLMEYPNFYAQLAPSLHPLLPLQSSELRAAITQPAAQPDVQLSFEGDLLGDLLFDVQRQAGALPLLQFTLQQLYERRQGHRLTLKAYKEIGEVNGALARYAQATYERLPTDQRELARILFLRLLEPGSSTEDSTRRRASLSELAFPDPDQTRRMQATIDTFISARLLTSSASPLTGQTSIEVSHEALIRAWPQLADWLRAARNDLPIQRKISEDAAQWQQNKQPADRLYRGSQLKHARAWAARNSLSVSTQEQTFLHASEIGRIRSILTVVLVTLLVIGSSGITLGLIYYQPNPNYVTNTNDDGIGSLRWAIANAKPNSTITFDPNLSDKTITLTSSDIHIRQQGLIIQGSKHNPPVISSKTFGWSIIIDTPASVDFDDLAFQESTNTTKEGNIIINRGKLNLSNCLISHNISSGGSISNVGILNITNSIISDNIAINSDASGGGIYNQGYVSIDSSVISHNIAKNSNSGGGGIFSSGTLEIRYSTISYNITSSGGGGIFSSDNILNVLDSTISDNIVTVEDSSSGGGIAVYSTEPNIFLGFCTIYRNKVGKNSGSAIFLNAINPNFAYMQANIVAMNDTDRNSAITGGTIHSRGYNLVQNMTSTNSGLKPTETTDRSVNDTTKIFGSTPKLEGSGSTATYILQSSSDNPAINAIPLQACVDDQGQPINADQRGMPRPGRNKHSKPACDIGAYESSN